MAVTNRLWQSFVAVAGWSSHQAPSNGRTAFGHNRSLSSILRSASPKPSTTHARSNSIAESSMSADIARSRPSTPQPRRVFVAQSVDDDNDLSTIPDPRSRAMSPANLTGTPTSHHPDLDQEVATLSTKLINAINHQTTLDDNLSATRLELEKSRERIRELEALVEEQREMLSGDVWVKRASVEAEKAKLVARIAEEKRARVDVEQQKKKIEQELENLTAALFEEANKMVISAKEEARKEQEALHRKNDQLKAQIADTEGLLRSQQEQLAELKHVMEQMTAEREEPPTVPSSPGLSKFDTPEAIGPSVTMRSHSLSVSSSPSYPTSFTHLLHPVLRTDLAAYNDFKDLLRTSKRLSGPRVPSASSGSGLTSLGIGLGSVASHVSAGNASTSSLATTGSPAATSPQTPVTPASSISTSSSTATPILPHLKETKFYKRVLTEDIEPTLRLDTAPGLSWLARRSVLTSMTDGSLVVEPTPSTATGRFGKVIKPELYPCSLCGESRKEDDYLRTHRFRISESDTSQVGYPLCKYCLARVRSTCEFLGFLRIVKDGHWRADDEDAEKAAWEESVRLREQMFWSRIGGGVVPTGHGRHPSSSSAAPSIRGERSPRPSHDVGTSTEDMAAVAAVELVKELPELPKTPEPEETIETTQSPNIANEERVVPAETTTHDLREEIREAVQPPSMGDMDDAIPRETLVTEQETRTLSAGNSAAQHPNLKPTAEGDDAHLVAVPTPDRTDPEP
ncbi:rab guanine nucleotide exchange factor S2 [Madurella fahalii]|uniref:Rab guanine nucleotide exchange factor S2 n=1 Tax=Madurella fahalii TaxID=1157608 RepID=A0ABQ0G3I9_9PEZI